MSSNPYRNSEHYKDGTAGRAIQNASKQPEHINYAIDAIRAMMKACGLEIVGRITIRDTKTGRIYK